jgi:hypothetical protein
MALNKNFIVDAGLEVATTATVGNSTVNVVISTTTLTTGNTNVTTTGLTVGNTSVNNTITQTSIRVGNSTVNTVITSNSVTLAGPLTTSNTIAMGGNELQNVKLARYTEKVTSLGTTSGTITLDCANANIFDVTLNANSTVAFSNVPSSGTAVGVTLVVKQDAVGGRTLGYPGSVKWTDGQAAVLATGAAKTDIITFFTIDGGTNWLSSQALANT